MNSSRRRGPKNSGDLEFDRHLPQSSAPSNKKHIRQIFDDISLSVITFLEKHRGVTDVKFFERNGAKSQQIFDWETANHPCKLPEDYNAFLRISNGFLLRWHMKYNGEVLPLGCMHLSSLDNLKPVQLTNFQSKNETNSGFPRGFDIDSTFTDGKIVLLFENELQSPSIWLQDLSCEWHLIGTSFTAYYRLMILHLGLPHWQYAFSRVGLPPTTMQWLRFLSPDRLRIDLRHNGYGMGWIMPRSKAKDVPTQRISTVNLNKIDQIAKMQLAKNEQRNKSNGSKQTSAKSGRPGTAPSHKQLGKK